MKILNILVLSLAVGAIASLTVKKAETLKNQPHAFPYSAEAPVNKTNLGTTKYGIPLLSNSLAESNPKMRIRLPEFLDLFKFSYYKLTRGEAEEVFHFANKNKDDLIDQKEWDDFIALYILPFEACDTNKNMLIDQKEFQKCLENDPRSQVIEFRRRYIKAGTPSKFIVELLATRGVPEMSFAGYLFFRKALFGWSECQSTSKYISKTSFRCAVLSSIPQKYNLKFDYDVIYNTGLNISNDRNLIELDFVSYIRVSYYLYYFVTFGQPLNIPFLEKPQFIRSIQEDRLPTNFEESEINLIYDLTYNNFSMDFPTFSFFFHLKGLFNKYSIQKPMHLNKTELLSLLNDEFAPKDIAFAIDNAFTNFSEAEYLEASLVLNKRRVNEKSFFSFKQDASFYTKSVSDNSTVNANFVDLKENKTNREVFFTTMLNFDKSFWDKENFYRAFLISNLFVSIRDLPLFHNVAILQEKLQGLYDTVCPTWSANQRKNYIFYKALPRDIALDLLSFLALENFVHKIEIHRFNAETVIEETLLKAILKDNGMGNMPDPVIDLGKKGFDSLRRREFIALDVVKFTVIVHSAASELKRTKHHFEVYKLNENMDNSRIFPSLSRRFRSSAMV